MNTILATIPQRCSRYQSRRSQWSRLRGLVAGPELQALGVPDSAGGVTGTRARGRVQPFSGKLGGVWVGSFLVGDEVCRPGDTVAGLRWHSG